MLKTSADSSGIWVWLVGS